MQALVAQAPPHNVLRATPSFSAEFGAAAGGAVAVGGPVAFLVGPETCRGTAAVLLDAVKNRRTCAVRMIAYSMCGRRSRLADVSVSPGAPLPDGQATVLLDVRTSTTAAAPPAPPPAATAPVATPAPAPPPAVAPAPAAAAEAEVPATKRARLKETLIEAALAANGAMDDAGDGDDDGEEGEEAYDSDEEDARAEASAAAAELFALSRAARSEASLSIDASRDDDDVDMDQILALHKRGRSLSRPRSAATTERSGGPSSAGASRARDKPAPFLTKLMEILESGTYEGLIKWVAPTDGRRRLRRRRRRRRAGRPRGRL